MNKHSFFSSNMFALVVIAVVGAVFAFGLRSFAVPPGSQYAPGETLDPTCEPGDSNCTVAVGNTTQATSGTQNTGQIPFWTATSKELSKGTSSFFWDATNSRLGIGTNTPSATLSLISAATNGASLLEVSGVQAGDSTVGSDIYLTAADGGPSALGSAGGGGDIEITSGSGADGATSNSSGGSIALFGGDGGGGNALNGKSGGGIGLVGGEGAFSSGASGGPGGNVVISGGEAGSGASGTLGVGGSITLSAGSGGSVSSGTNPNGGDVFVRTGIAGSGGSGGRDGNVVIADTRGLVGIGITTPLYHLHVKGDDGAGNIAKFETTGGATSCTLDGVSGLLNCSSDERLKKNIESIGSTLSDVLALRPVSYIWRTEDDGADKKYGFIAQEVEALFPSTVRTDKDTGYKSFSSQGLIPYIVKAIKELNDKVDSMSGAASTVVNNVVNAVLEKLTVGSAEAPTGITLFDKTTTEPYCLSINNGIIETTPGACQ